MKRRIFATVFFVMLLTVLLTVSVSAADAPTELSVTDSVGGTPKLVELTPDEDPETYSGGQRVYTAHQCRERPVTDGGAKKDGRHFLCLPSLYIVRFHGRFTPR